LDSLNKMANYLLTGARAPVTLELARNLNRYGHTVYVTDCLNYPIARNSKAVKAYFKTTSPRVKLNLYCTQLIKIITTQNIDILIPTCEEVFYIAYIKSKLDPYCSILCSDFKLLSFLHSKINIKQVALRCNIQYPKSTLLENIAIKNTNLHQKIIKREFCRFGTNVIHFPTQKKLLELYNRKNKKIRYLVQDKIEGEEFCTYSIIQNHQLLVHVTYSPTYRIKSAAGIYFTAQNIEAIRKFMQLFTEKYDFNGQIGFDFILNKKGLYMLDCNPRATSGIHLLANKNLSDYLHLNPPRQLQTPDTTRNITPDRANVKAAKISFAMILTTLPQSIIQGKLKKWILDYRQANEVIFSKTDKSLVLYLILSLFEIIFRAIKHNVSFRAASTQDIEWDGENIE